MNEAIYNTIGKGYDITRKADPHIVNQLMTLLNAKSQAQYLDIACGSGNYTSALATQGLKIDGVDISDEMLNNAKKKYPHVSFYQGDAHHLPFEDNGYQGAICTLATHHMSDHSQAFCEAYRVINQGQFVIFTSTPAQMKQYWLWHYFPMMMEDASDRMAHYDDLEMALTQAGFKDIQSYPFFVTNELQDLFLQSGKYRPHMYLDFLIRQGISSFHLSVNADELAQGLARLSKDIETGDINDIIHQYESDVGDYLFMVGSK